MKDLTIELLRSQLENKLIIKLVFGEKSKLIGGKLPLSLLELKYHTAQAFRIIRDSEESCDNPEEAKVLDIKYKFQKLEPRDQMLVTSLNFTYIDPHNDKIELDSELDLFNFA